MSISLIGWPALRLLLPVVLVSIICHFVHADEWDTAMHQRSATQSAETGLIKSQLELENRNHAQLEEQHKNGFVSWLEVRRHKLAVDTIGVGLESAHKFQKFLSEVETEQQSIGDGHPIVFNEREVSPIKVFFPGSIRLIGWIEGQTLPNKESVPSVSFDEIEYLVTAEQSDGLKLATLTVAKAEANANWHVKGTQILLDREQRRFDAIRQLKSHGHASANDLAVVSSRLAELTAQLDAMTKHRGSLKQTFEETGEPNRLTVVPSYGAVNTWPAVVFNDTEFASHLIDLRREYYNEYSIVEISQLKSEMLNEVLIRLRTAATQAKPDSPFGSILLDGQHNEIASYESNIEFAKTMMLSASERQQILVHEENRFIQQTIAQCNAAISKRVISQLPSLNALGLLSLIRPSASVTLPGNSLTSPHYSYLESGDFKTVGHSSSLLFSQSKLSFIGSPNSASSLNHLILSPVPSSLMISDSRRTYPSQNLKTEPDWMKYFNRNLGRNSRTTLRHLHDDYRSQKNYSGRSGYGSIDSYHAYPYGILRDDLRSRMTPGQIPWYLPGSPTNIRANRLNPHRGNHHHHH